ncbi:IS3 family transposase [Brevibacillus laterosporus]|uniref:IS3 family transposase n=1 Tax=Brevibacillus laterosporus TaxID=1465 RepID=A0A518VBD1_BRELA|nr:IS3 family transposase [Brevibacillus laterosporus]QDX92498.1 IS3 family transposase [Brevibacillus laterosporus]QDX94295.1 IS3 family transposase [Brevibacillus laterosporus]
MAKKGQTFQRYTMEFKQKAIALYEQKGISYEAIAKELGVPSPTQIKNWVRKYRDGDGLEDQRGKTSKRDNPFIGRPRTKFTNVEEERDYLKAQVEYLKKRLSKSTRGGWVSKVARFAVIDQLVRKYPVTWLVEIAKVSRAGYYKWKHTQEERAKRQQHNKLIKEHMMAIHRVHPYFGYPRMRIALRKKGFIVNHKRVYRLMKEMNVQSIIRKKRRFFGKTASIVNPNLLNRKFTAEKPNQLYVTDITFVALNDRFYYLSVIQDLFNNEVVAWKVSHRNDLKLVLDTLEQLAKQRDVQEAILHSDQGFQYTSKQYNKRLREFGVRGSHSRKGNCLDNACIESFFSHLKTETLYFSECKTDEELFQAIEKYIWFYNHERFQKKLNQCAPVEYRNTLAA